MLGLVNVLTFVNNMNSWVSYMVTRRNPDSVGRIVWYFPLLLMKLQFFTVVRLC